MTPGAILPRGRKFGPHFQSTELQALWKEMLVKVQVPHVYHSNLWPAQVTARLTLELMIEKKYSSLQPASYVPKPKPLDADEANALRYAAGYVLRSIKQKEKKKSPNSAVVAWIKQVSTEIDSTANRDTYQPFTKLWVEKVNRGGLFLLLVIPYTSYFSPWKLCCVSAYLNYHRQSMVLT